MPNAGTTASVDGYAVTVAGTPKADTEVPLTLTVARNGKSVSDLQPYLDTYAHVTAIHAGGTLRSRICTRAAQSTATTGYPHWSSEPTSPSQGSYRIFIKFQTAGKVHTAALTLAAS